MAERSRAAPVAAPLVLLEGPVDPAWIDRNDHIGIRGYADALAQGSGHFLRHLKLNFDEAHHEGSTVYSIRWHMSFVREVRKDAMLRYTVQLLDFNEKTLHYLVAMHHAGEGYLAATSEYLEAHVLLATRRTAPMPPDRLARVEAVWATHKALPWPEGAGQGIAIRRGGRRGEK